MADIIDKANAWAQELNERAIKHCTSKIASEHKKSAKNCIECGEPIPEARRQALPGVNLCITCQRELENEYAI